MQASHPSDTWHLTIVCTKGLQFVRPEKSWRPIVSVFVMGNEQTHETILGSDGQNPNLKMPLLLRDVGIESKLDIRVWHKSHSKSKNRKKRHLVGSVYISLGELLKKQDSPGANLDLRLSCPGPQKKSPTVRGRQLHYAVLTVRLHPPSYLITPPSSAALHASSSSSSSSNVSDDDSEAASDFDVDQAPPSGEACNEELKTDSVDVGNQLRRRRRRRIQGYRIGSDDDPCTSVSCESSGPSTPHEEYFPSFREDDSFEDNSFEFNDSKESGGWFSSMMLPRYVDQISMQTPLSLAESILDIFTPYRELQEATLECDFEKVLGRLLTEWYVVGASLLALAGIDAAVFGFNPGTLFDTDGAMQRVVAFGAISAGLGIVFDAWFLFLYSGANATKFQKLATDVYNSYFFFCLTCRLPTLFMFLSAVALMVFLLGVAWTRWPTAVLVMSCVAGTLISLQYLVFGFHRLWNFGIWCGRSIWWVVRGRRAFAESCVSSQEQPAPETSPSRARGKSGD
ncbi:hypothetical protein SCP_0100470 [Sparassis crispa]|uniref:C2 domain-containing protein n=1 Tax=Sparassis crispa TaxID=139825 RepID=A0A401G4T5_9APHY|nr:hypothetical protein SCP_0100470 [Sparassis crispa]GBE77175.1 hypothetical protein SCP_0100470 [Sparassis crispa]